MDPTAVGGEKPYRTAYAADVSEAKAGERVRLAGWVARRRDQGGVYFFDLRDVSGLVQVVVDPAEVPAARDLRMEYCITVEGTVRPRPAGMGNPELATGNVELAADQLEVLSRSEPLPFIIDDRSEADERLRLEYRYLDLRRPRMARNLRARSVATAAMRDVLNGRDFLEIETPTLIRSTPEGARDMLVPSRLRRGDFYALPQSPQLFKQLLMVGGVDRYYQIARCYRDEDFRSDRQLEFTQLDVEGSFWGREGVLETFEAVVAAVVERLRGVTLNLPFPRLAYAEALLRYGTDKPDLRFGMEISDLSDVFAETGFRAFSATLEAGGVIRGFNAGDRQLSRSQIDGLETRAKELGAKGLVSAVVEEGGSLRSPTTKFLSEPETTAIVKTLGGAPGDLLLLVADTARTAAQVLGQLRLDVGKPAGHDELVFLWVIDFPIFDELESGDLAPSHHPFTAPVDLIEMRERPRQAIAKAYDLVLNGSELGSGSVRIHDPEVQQEVFKILGISAEEAESRFGWFVKALRYGTPPHAGFAMGVDRLLAILQRETSIRDVIPFPKTQTGIDPMTGSPTAVDPTQLAELGIALRVGPDPEDPDREDG
ncbi:MAG: aspartate--tRNA ligase [Acidimicrobiia bacterium]|nr:aspartate--tRNA ligase [Acidimicrobiia bacterium]MDH3397109.1 aspartate--tRNA ligase [Acidimicrobiia bacterium]